MPGVGSPALEGAVNPFDHSAAGVASLPFAVVATGDELVAAIALQNAFGVGGMIIAVPGTYDFPAGAGPTITRSGVEILLYGCSIVFHPTGHDQAAFTFDNGASTLNYCAIRGATFSSPDTTYRKIMISHVESWGFRVSDISAADGAWGDASFLSEGVRSKGRFRHRLYDVSIHTDIPVHEMVNPRFATIDADHSYFGPGLDLASTNGNPVVKVDAAVVLSNVTFDGFAFQKGGFEWAGTNATASIHLKFANGRCEQMTAGKWCFDINGTTLMQALTLDNVRLSPTGKGIRARHVTQLNLRQVFDGGSVMALDIDGTVYNTKGDNVRVGGATTVSIVGQKLVRAGSLPEETTPLPSPFFEYQSTSSANAITTTELGLRKLTFIANGLANNGQVQLADTFDGTEKTVEFRVLARNASTGAAVGGVVFATGGASGTAYCPATDAYILAGQAAVAAGLSAPPPPTFGAGNLAGKLTILWQSQSNIILLNQLGVAVDYAIKMTVYK